MARYSQHLGNGEYIHYGQKEHDNAVMMGAAFDLSVLAYKHKVETVSLVAFIVGLTTPLLWPTLIQPIAAIVLGIVGLVMHARTEAPVARKFKVFALLGLTLPFIFLLLGILLLMLFFGAQFLTVLAGGGFNQ